MILRRYVGLTLWGNSPGLLIVVHQDTSEMLKRLPLRKNTAANPFKNVGDSLDFKLVTCSSGVDM